MKEFWENFLSGLLGATALVVLILSIALCIFCIGASIYFIGIYIIGWPLLFIVGFILIMALGSAIFITIKDHYTKKKKEKE